MTLQVLDPGMPHVLSKGLHEHDIFRVKLVRALLLRKSLRYETLDTVESESIDHHGWEKRDLREKPSSPICS
jgi:hypothetical protein